LQAREKGAARNDMLHLQLTQAKLALKQALAILAKIN